MVLSAEQERVRSLIADTVSLLCKNGLHYTKEFSIEGLLGITLDHDEVFLVNIKEIVKTEMSKDYLESGSGSEESTNPNPSSRRRRRKRQRKNTGDGVESDSDNEMNSSVHGGRDNSSKKNIKLEDNDSGDDLVFVKNEPGLNHSNNFSSNFSGLSGATSATNDILGDLSQQGQLYATPTSNPLPSPSWDPHHSTNSLYNTPNHQQAMNVMSPTASPGGSMQHMGQQQTGNLSRLQQCAMGPVPSLLLSPPPRYPQLSPSCGAAVVSTSPAGASSPRGSTGGGSGGKYKCQACNKTFCTATGYKSHCDSHNGIYQYNCSYCQKGFTGKLALLEHTTSHTNINNFPCRMCDQTFRYAYRLKTHQRAVHSANGGGGATPGRPSKKGEAAAAAGTPKATRPYKRRSVAGGGSSSKEVGASRSRTNSTSSSTPGGGTGIYSCSICGKQLSSRTGLRSHEDAHRGVFRYSCPECSRGFHSHSHLRGHMATHTHVREFSCPHCNKEYAYSGDLSRHVSTCPARTPQAQLSNNILPQLPEGAVILGPLPPGGEPITAATLAASAQHTAETMNHHKQQQQQQQQEQHLAASMSPPPPPPPPLSREQQQHDVTQTSNQLTHREHELQQQTSQVPTSREHDMPPTSHHDLPPTSHHSLPPTSQHLELSHHQHELSSNHPYESSSNQRYESSSSQPYESSSNQNYEASSNQHHELSSNEHHHEYTRNQLLQREHELASHHMPPPRDHHHDLPTYLPAPRDLPTNHLPPLEQQQMPPMYHPHQDS